MKNPNPDHTGDQISSVPDTGALRFFDGTLQRYEFSRKAMKFDWYDVPCFYINVLEASP